MKIAFVLNTFPVVSEVFIVNQIYSLIDAGHQVTIYTFRLDTNTINHKKIIDYGLIEKTVEWIAEPKSKRRRLFTFFKLLITNKVKYDLSQLFRVLNFFKYGKGAFSLHLFFRNQWFLKKNQFDIIHSHFGQCGQFIAQLKSKGLLNDEKLVTTFHGLDITPNKILHYKKSYRLLFNTMNVCTYNSLYSLSILKEIAPDYNKFEYLPVGLDLSLFKKRKVKQSSNTNILFCGRLVPFKGPDIAIEIFEKLVSVESDVHLTILGTGPMESKIKKLIEDKNLAKHVTLKGAVTQEIVVKYMQQAHIFLLPGREDPNTKRAENQGLVIQEAQSMELPVIVSDAGGMKYGLINNKTGFVVKTNDVDGFVEKIILLIHNDELRYKMGERGREFVKQNYSNAYLCDKLLNIYSKK